jgi:hypothetical protein
VDGKFTFAGAEAGHRFIDRAANIFCGHIAEQEKACGIGMPGQVFVSIFTGQHMDGSMFQGVISPCSKVGM